MNLPDFVLTNHGSVVTLTPMSAEASDWAYQYLPDEAFHGRSAVIEPRYVADILDGIEADGLTVS